MVFFVYWNDGSDSSGCEVFSTIEECQRYVAENFSDVCLVINGLDITDNFSYKILHEKGLL